jgi:gliding motility-associated-like protein
MTYKARRNAGCVVPITWRFDTAFVKLVSTTDSSHSFQFKHTGHTKIYSTVKTPCGDYIDSIEVDIMPSANTVSLGPDATICPGNTVVLNTKKGYASYRWQDGSTDSTFKVSLPGLYYVVVSDLCGQSYTDSIRVDPHPPISFDVSPDRIKCDKDTLLLSAPPGFLNYSWSPAYNISSSMGQTVAMNPAVDTTYFVKAEKLPGCFVYDTIRVTVYQAPAIELGPDLSFCRGESRILDPGAGFSSYQWNTGVSTQQLTVDKPGQYIITGTTNEGCKASDTLSVLHTWTLPVVNLDKTTTLCTGATRTLNAGTYTSFHWHDGSAEQTYNVSGPGRYYVTVTDAHGCHGSDTTTITTLLPSPAKFLPPDTAICDYSKLQIKPQQTYPSYLWSTGGRASNITVEKSGLYWLQVEDDNRCIGRDTLVVFSKECMNGVYVPTAFSPNKDGKNDVFRAIVFGRVKKFELTVYNRWGQVIFQTPDHKKGWDGKVAGHEQDTGVCVWLCRYQLEGGKETVEKGTVTVIR